MTHDTRASGTVLRLERTGHPPRAPSVVSTSREGPRASPLPRELQRHARAPGSPAAPLRLRVNGAGRDRRIRGLRPADAFDRPLPIRQEPRRPAPRSFPRRALRRNAGSGSFHDDQLASGSRALVAGISPGPIERCPTSGVPSPGATSAARRSDEGRLPDRDRFLPPRVNVTALHDPGHLLAAQEDPLGSRAPKARPSPGDATRGHHRARPSSVVRPPVAPGESRYAAGAARHLNDDHARSKRRADR